MGCWYGYSSMLFVQEDRVKLWSELWEGHMVVPLASFGDWSGFWAEEIQSREEKNYPNSPDTNFLCPVSTLAFSRSGPEFHHLYLAIVPLTFWQDSGRLACTSAADPFSLGQVPLPFACSWSPVLWFHWEFTTWIPVTQPAHAIPH